MCLVGKFQRECSFTKRSRFLFFFQCRRERKPTLPKTKKNSKFRNEGEVVVKRRGRKREGRKEGSDWLELAMVLRTELAIGQEAAKKRKDGREGGKSGMHGSCRYCTCLDGRGSTSFTLPPPVYLYYRPQRLEVPRAVLQNPCGTYKGVMYRETGGGMHSISGSGDT